LFYVVAHFERSIDAAPSTNLLRPVLRPPSEKINLKQVSHFSPRKNARFSTTFSHTFHHNFTTKTPQRNAHFSQNPLQKRRFTMEQKICE